MWKTLIKRSSYWLQLLVLKKLPVIPLSLIKTQIIDHWMRLTWSNFSSSFFPRTHEYFLFLFSLVHMIAFLMGSWYVYITHLDSFFISLLFLPFSFPPGLNLPSHLIKICLSTSYYLLFIVWDSHIREIRWYISLCVWFHSLNMVSWCRHFSTNDPQLSLFMAE